MSIVLIISEVVVIVAFLSSSAFCSFRLAARFSFSYVVCSASWAYPPKLTLANGL